MSSKWIIRLAIFAGICILIATILRLLTPQTAPLPLTETTTTNLDGSQTAFEKITFTGSEPSVSRALPVVPVVSQENPAVGALVSNLNLKPVPNVENIWQGEAYSMAVIQQTGFVSLGLNEHSEDDDKTPINVQAARQKAQEFIDTYLKNQNLELIEDETKYAIDDDGRPAEESNALYATYFFSPKISNIPVKVGSVNQPSVRLTLNHSLEITSAQFFPISYQMGEPQTKNVISVKDAVANIERDKAAIVQVSQSEYRPVDLSRVVSANLTSVEVEYRPDAELKLVYPFYIFSGTAVDAGGAEITVQIATPAVATTSN